MNRPSLSACRAQKDNHGAQPSDKPKAAKPPKLPPSLEVLVKRFPLAFNLNDRKPLKIENKELSFGMNGADIKLALNKVGRLNFVNNLTIRNHGNRITISLMQG